MPPPSLGNFMPFQRPSTFPNNPPSLDPLLSAQFGTTLTLKSSDLQQSTANRRHAMEGTRGAKWQERSITRRSLRSGLIDLPIRDVRQSPSMQISAERPTPGQCRQLLHFARSNIQLLATTDKLNVLACGCARERYQVRKLQDFL